MTSLSKHIEKRVTVDHPFQVDDLVKRHELGQFLTPMYVADFMASLFTARRKEIDLLDTGAGKGALTAAFMRRLCAQRNKPRRVSVTAYELDPTLIESLKATLDECQCECERSGIAFTATIHNKDFIAAAVPMVRTDFFVPETQYFTVAIVNPPYRKIHSDSEIRLLLRSAEIETSNLYTGFMALIIRLLIEGGELVAITPRSFCNGPYFKPFRLDFLKTLSLRRLHVYESRSEAFGQDDVLQENIIFHAVKGISKPERVVISSSSGGPGNPICRHQRAYTEIVSPRDPEQFIHLIVDDENTQARLAMAHFHASLDELGLSVSTGRVVDFRAKPFLHQRPEPHAVPLIYPCHFNGGFVSWPKENTRKPNAIINDKQTRELLVPNGVYVLVKRFTSKEERRRVVACISDPERVKAPFVGFENHLNYFHVMGHGLPMSLAKGLAAFLNSTLVDNYFRQFSGHTQVNANDLRSLNYPSKTDLERLGRKIDDPGMEQSVLDELVEKEFF